MLNLLCVRGSMHVFVCTTLSFIYCQISLSAKDLFFIKQQKLYQSCGLLFLKGSVILGIQSTNNNLFMMRTSVTELKHGSLKRFLISIMASIVPCLILSGLIAATL